MSGRIIESQMLRQVNFKKKRTYTSVLLCANRFSTLLVLPPLHSLLILCFYFCLCLSVQTHSSIHQPFYPCTCWATPSEDSITERHIRTRTLSFSITNFFLLLTVRGKQSTQEQARTTLPKPGVGLLKNKSFQGPPSYHRGSR